MAKDNKPSRKFADIIPGVNSRKIKKAVRQAKQTTKKTTEQASKTIKSISDQVVGAKPPEATDYSATPVTTETVAQRREEVLSEARKFIHPMHTRRRIVAVSIGIVLGVIGLTVLLSGIMLYGFQSSNRFAYNVSKFVPFPVARVDGEFVSFERYLFELRYTLHYLRNFPQEGVDIDSERGKALVLDTKKRALAKVQRDKLAQQLAREHGIKVSSQEIDEQIKLFAVTGGIDQSEGTLENVLAKYYGFDMNGLRRVVKMQLIYQKLLPIIDEQANQKLEKVQTALAEGTRFKTVVDDFSEDRALRDSGGKIGEISRLDNNFTATVSQMMFSLEEGETSEPVPSVSGYHIYRVDKVVDEDSRQISQIFIAFLNIDIYLADQLESVAHRGYIEIVD